MSSFGSQIRKRLDELRRAGQDMPKILAVGERKVPRLRQYVSQAREDTA